MNMSGGTPIGGGYMRRRHSQGYTSSGDDLEDDACSRPIYQSPSSRSRRWVEIMENLLWISSVIFIMYYGDGRSNFIYLLWHDDRIKRKPLYVGLIGVGLNVLFFFYTCIIARGLRKATEKWEASSTPALPFITVIGILSFCLFCFALWPIWSFLTLPLVFTLFMAFMVILPYEFLGTLKKQIDSFRTD
ncbi:uncharacterized protein [Primulina huaijiensis]|uniref:uncharacterized protein isoform X2 n=1 Tax=Primulina huaijiensis TaxID=1492673 RepID=UPI003CC6E7FB